MSQRESNPDLLIVRLQGRTAIAHACDTSRAFGEGQLLNDDELARLCIVIEELVANLYDHGGLELQDEVELSLFRETGGIRVTIVDSGNAFDPWNAPRSAERKERGGGVGIDIIKAWALFTSYDTSADGNRLEFLLPIHWEG